MPVHESAPARADLLTAHLRLIRAVVAEHVPRRYREHREDVVQTVALHVWRYTIPAFDPSRGAALSTLIYVAARQATLREVARLNRRPPADRLGPDTPARTSPDVERTAAEILAHPERYLTRRQCELLALLRAGADIVTIAAQMGLAVRGVWLLDYKLRKRLGEVVG
jgi:hypothetical protein